MSTATPGDSASLASFYSSSAEAYRSLWAPELLKMSPALLDALPLRGARTVLDAGAGVGSLLNEIATRAPDALIVGADIAEGMLRLAPPEFPRVLSDTARLPFPADTFDAVTLVFVLFHLPDPPAGLREVARVLRPGGSVGTLTWGDDPSYPACDIWTEELDRIGAAQAEPAIARHDLVDTPDKVMSMLAEAGFREADAWLGEYSNVMTAEGFLSHRVGHGASKRRFEALDDGSRATCLERARARLAQLGSEDLTDRAEVIYAVART